MFELFYGSGGHGGPYSTLEAAQKAALAFVRAGSERRITISTYSASGFDPCDVVEKCPRCDSIQTSWGLGAW